MAQEFDTTSTVKGPSFVPRAALLENHPQIIGVSTHRYPALTAADIRYQDSSQLKCYIALGLVQQHAAAAKALSIYLLHALGHAVGFRVWWMQDCA